MKSIGKPRIHGRGQEPPADTATRFGPLASRLREIVLERVHEERFGVEDLASAVAMSRSTLFRKLKDEAGISPAELLRTTRLECAAELLACGEGNVSEIAYAVGFDTPRRIRPRLQAPLRRPARYPPRP